MLQTWFNTHNLDFASPRGPIFTMQSSTLLQPCIDTLTRNESIPQGHQSPSIIHVDNRMKIMMLIGFTT